MRRGSANQESQKEAKEMKKLIILIALFFLVGCVSQIKIPDAPKFKRFYIYQIEGGICLDKEGMNTLVENIKSMEAYEKELLRLLKEATKQ